MDYGPRRQNHRTADGFSLIELISSLSILMVLVVLLSMVFVTESNGWKLGADRAERNAVGRSAIHRMADDLQYAVADDLLAFAIRPDKHGLKPYNVVADEICFVSLRHDSHDRARTAREIFYYVRKDDSCPGLYNLVMGYYGKSISDNPGRHAYSAYQRYGREWYDVAGRPGGRPQVVAQYVAGLSFFAVTPDTDASTGQPVVTRHYESRTQGNELPLYLDIYLELLDGAAARRLSKMMSTGHLKGDSPRVQEYVEKHLTRYTRRVHFQNRNGYHRRTAAP